VKNLVKVKPRKNFGETTSEQIWFGLSQKKSLMGTTIADKQSPYYLPMLTIKVDDGNIHFLVGTRLIARAP
jgi:hypothetical protein